MAGARWAFAAVLAASAGDAFAQAAVTPPEAAVGAPVVDEASNLVVYDQAFFARYSVQNAEDMLRRIPGVSAVLDADSNQQERGFGSTGAQVLINGRRFPGKNTVLVTTLRRLPANNVERVELIRGASDEIDVQNEGLVVNIILKAGAQSAGTSQISYEVALRFNDWGEIGGDGLLSYASKWGPLDYGFGIERNLWTPPSGGGGRWSNRWRDERYFYPTGQLLEARPQYWNREHSKWIYTGHVGHEWDNGDRATFNALYQRLHINETDNTPFVRYSTAGAETLRARDIHKRDVDYSRLIDLGGEYTAKLGPGSFKGLFIVNRTSRPSLDYRNRIEPTRTVEVSRSIADVDTAEDILRGSYTFPIGRGMTLEIGGEGAHNTLDQHLQAFFDLNADGRLEPVVIPTARAEVDEARWEAFIGHKWTYSDKLSFDTSINYEHSNLTTNYPFQPERSLSFVKPRFDVRYKPGPSDTIRFVVGRTVSQLDFANFVPRYNIPDDRIEAGNPALEPEKVWGYELAYERRLANDGGVVEARLYYDDGTDVIDKAPLVQNGVLTSALGNIPSGERYGVETKASLRLTAIGLEDAVLSLRYHRQWSNVIDPFTGDERRLTNDRVYNLDVGFRHDLTAQKLSYGFNYRNLGSGSINSDLTVYEYFTIAPLLEVFAERALTARTNIRIEAQNLLGSNEFKERTLYLSDVRNGQIRRFETFKETRDMRVAVRLRGRF